MAQPVTAVESVEVIKGGETIFQGLLSRTRLGLTLTVKIHPSVEDFFSTQAGGAHEDPAAYGRQWVPKDGEAFRCWRFRPSEQTAEEMVRKGEYTLTSLGGPLLVQNDGAQIINISFLRIVGLSENAGRSLSFREVCTEAEVDNLARKLQQGVRTFFTDFLRPKTINIVVSMQEK